LPFHFCFKKLMAIANTIHISGAKVGIFSNLKKTLRT